MYEMKDVNKFQDYNLNVYEVGHKKTQVFVFIWVTLCKHTKQIIFK